jgi:hypothetical protein
VTNGTVGKPSAGDTVTLIRLTTAMDDMASTTTDSRGHFSLQVPDDNMHLIRVTHDKAAYFAPVPPNTHYVAIDVYNAAPSIEGVSTQVEELHFEASANTLQVVEVLQVVNHSQPARTQFGPDGFDFFLPPNAQIKRTMAMRDQLPVPATAVPAGEAGHYKFLFPIRPGETQFGIFYDLPYTGKASLPLHVPRAVTTLAVLLPPSMTFTPGRGANFSRDQAQSAPGAQTWTTSQVPADATVDIAVSGTGSLPSQGATDSSGAAGPNAGAAPDQAATADTRPGMGLNNPLDPEGQRDPWGKYKWWILAGFVLLLAIAAALMLRKPAATIVATGEPPHPGQTSGPSAANSTPYASTHGSTLAALKEELFALETDRLQNRISESEYAAHKAALETVLRRVLARQPGATTTAPPTSGAA